MKSRIRLRIKSYQAQQHILPWKVHRQQLIPDQTLPTPTQNETEKFP